MTTTEDFDYDRSVEKAWRRFAVRLASVLSMMDETEPLTLQPWDEADGDWLVRFTQTVPGTLLAEAIPGEGHLGEAAALIGFGWEGAGGVFRLVRSQDHCGDLAAEVVTALREVFRVEHPVFLGSNILADILQEPPAGDDPTGRPAPGGEMLAFPQLDEVQLAAAVYEELTRFFGATPMQDQDGDFAVRVGSTMIFIRIPPDGTEIRLYSMLVHDVAGRSRAAEVINDVNAHTRWVRFHLVRDKIVATLPVLASPFVPAHFRQAITEMTKVADGVDDLLAASLQGKTTFPADQ